MKIDVKSAIIGIAAFIGGKALVKYVANNTKKGRQAKEWIDKTVVVPVKETIDSVIVKAEEKDLVDEIEDEIKNMEKK